MDNNFQGSLVQSTSAPSFKHKPQTLPSKFFIILIACLSFIIFLQAIALIFFITNFTAASTENASEDTGSTARETVNATFGADGELSTFNAVCTADNGAYFKIFKSGTYEQYDNSSNLINSGDYSMIKGIIMSTSPDHTLYYDGYYLADGTTIYDCEADNNAEISE